MPSVHIRKELYERLVSNGEDKEEMVNEILQNYISAQNNNLYVYSTEDLHLNEYREHGNAD